MMTSRSERKSKRKDVENVVEDGGQSTVAWPDDFLQR
jgi:hypothetical protein